MPKSQLPSNLITIKFNVLTLLQRCHRYFGVPVPDHSGITRILKYRLSSPFPANLLLPIGSRLTMGFPEQNVEHDKNGPSPLGLISHPITIHLQLVAKRVVTG